MSDPTPVPVPAPTSWAKFRVWAQDAGERVVLTFLATLFSTLTLYSSLNITELRAAALAGLSAAISAALAIIAPLLTAAPSASFMAVSTSTQAAALNAVAVTLATQAATQAALTQQSVAVLAGYQSLVTQQAAMLTAATPAVVNPEPPTPIVEGPPPALTPAEELAALVATPQG